jgi:hypothetical protein
MQAASSASGQNQSKGIFNQMTDITVNNMTILLLRHKSLPEIATKAYENSFPTILSNPTLKTYPYLNR